MVGLQGTPEGSFASGNIAQVLRQARASLKDPSRPFTPTERRLRSTKSLFGEAGFRPPVTRNSTPGKESRSSSSSNVDLWRKKLGPDHMLRLKEAARGFSNSRRRKPSAPSSRKREARVRSGSFVGRGADGQRHRELEAIAPDSAIRPSANGSRSGGSNTSHGEELSPRNKAETSSSLSNAIHEVSECPAYPLRSSPSLSSPDLGILYLDEGSPRGSTSRSIVNEWSIKPHHGGSNPNGNNNRRRRRTSRSNKNKGVVATTKELVSPTKNNRESGEYGGLYGSDDDVDTTAWDLGSVSVCSGISDEGSEEEIPPEAPRIVSGDRGDDDGDGHYYFYDCDFILDAIDNEADLSENCFGFGADADSDRSPDPGALEGQRERNARLTGLLRMLAQNLGSAAASKPMSEGSSLSSANKGGLCAGGAGRRSRELGVAEEAGGIHQDCSSPLASRTLGVLLRVLRRPRGPADASPPSVTELPGLLAARMVVSLALAPLLPTAQTGSGGWLDDDDDSRGANNSAQVETRRANDVRAEHHKQLLGEACRHLFEASKKAGADEAFFSSGAVASLLEFVDSAASDLSLTPGEVDFSSIIGTQGRRRARGGLCAEETAQSPDGRGGDDATPTSNSTSNSRGSSTSTSTSSHRNASRNSTFDGGDLFCSGGGHVQSVCDSLTFAIGCLKNVSADEGLQDRLVEAGSIRKLCRLVRGARDLCHRGDQPKRQQSSRAGPPQQPLEDDDQEHQFNNNDWVDPGGEGSGVVGGGREKGSCRRVVSHLRDRVAPLLAQAISLLRDLAAGGKDRSKAFRAAGAIRTLCSILPAFRDYQDVLLNTARALAKLSLQEKTRADINSNPAHARHLLAALVEQGREIDGSFGDLEEHCRDFFSSRSTAAAAAATSAAGGGSATAAAVPVEQRRRRHWERQEKRVATCVRIAFALGNLTSASDENRRLIGVRLGGAESIPALLLSSSRAHVAAWESLRCVESDCADAADRSADGGGGSDARGRQAAPFPERCWSRRALGRACEGLEEMLVKMMRLLANISIHREVGQQVCRHPGLAALEPLVGTCLELFGLFEDGALPHADPCGQRDRRSGAGRRNEALMVPGEELLLNAVSLVTNLSFYGPDLEDSRVVAPVDLAPPNSSSNGEGVSFRSRSRVAEPPPSPTAAGPPYASTLFALASKARREAGQPNFGTGGGDAGHNNPRSDFGKDDVGNNAVTATPHSCAGAGAGANGGGGGRRREVLCGHLVKVLLHPNAEAVAEAARAFGNFSRDRSCRDAMNRRRADEVLVALLGHRSREVVFAAAGALVNVAADKACKALLSRESVGAGERLARLVRRAGLTDPSLAELGCQALHNMLLEPLPPGGAEEVLGGPDTCQKLWWTLKELMEACSCEGVGVGARAGAVGGGQGGEGGGGSRANSEASRLLLRRSGGR